MQARRDHGYHVAVLLNSRPSHVLGWATGPDRTLTNAKVGAAFRQRAAVDINPLQRGKRTASRRSTQMGVVMIWCPTTRRPVPTGIETDPRTFASLPDEPTQTKCPACGSVHVWWKGEAWLAADGDSDSARQQRPKGRKAAR